MIWVLWVMRCSEVWGRHPLPAGDSAPTRPQGSLLPSELSLSPPRDGVGDPLLIGVTHN